MLQGPEGLPGRAGFPVRAFCNLYTSAEPYLTTFKGIFKTMIEFFSLNFIFAVIWMIMVGNTSVVNGNVVDIHHHIH